jgi:hypothetical protein
MMTWEDAARIVSLVDAGVAGDPTLEALRRDWLRAAAAYAQARAEWSLADRARRAEMDRHRTLLHEAFIAACNALSRQMRAAGRSIEWRADLGDDRRRIGDLACHLHCRLGLDAR